METRTIEARTHGRYVVRTPSTPGPWPVIVGFHGYGENAAAHLTMLERIPATEGWLLVAIQGLHRFYTQRGDVVVASWMTREDRELAIADNVTYVGQVVDAVRVEFPTSPTLVFFGFSQGTAMAFRSAAHLGSSTLIVAGGDVPPDVSSGTSTLPPVLYGRGRHDNLYSAESHAKDIAILNRLGVPTESVIFEGRHELAPEFLAIAGRTLAELSDVRRESSAR
jgi:predicted esterase